MQVGDWKLRLTFLNLKDFHYDNFSRLKKRLKGFARVTFPLRCRKLSTEHTPTYRRDFKTFYGSFSKHLSKWGGEEYKFLDHRISPPKYETLFNPLKWVGNVFKIPDRKNWSMKFQTASTIAFSNMQIEVAWPFKILNGKTLHEILNSFYETLFKQRNWDGNTLKNTSLRPSLSHPTLCFPTHLAPVHLCPLVSLRQLTFLSAQVEWHFSHRRVVVCATEFNGFTYSSHISGGFGR